MYTPKNGIFFNSYQYLKKLRFLVEMPELSLIFPEGSLTVIFLWITIIRHEQQPFAKHPNGLRNFMNALSN